MTSSTTLHGTRQRLAAASLTALALTFSACATPQLSSSPPADQGSGASSSAAPQLSASPAAAQSPGASSSTTPQLNDPYSLQIARSSQITVDTSAFRKTAPFKVATIVQGPINGWGTIFDAVMNEQMIESGKFDMARRLYIPWDFQTENQVKGVDDAIAQGVDAIMLTSLSRAGLSAAVDRAFASRTPVILCMAGVETDNYTAEVNTNIPLMGYDSAKAVAEKIGGKGNVILLHGIAGVDAAEFWKSGAEAAFAEYPDINIVSEQYGNWSVADSLNVMRTVIVQNPNVDAIWAGGMEMGMGAAQAYKEAGLPVPFIGGTGPINGFLRTAISDNLDFYVEQFPPAASQQCVNTMIDVLEGKPVQKFTDATTLMAGVGPFGTAQVATEYKPQFNDDFIGPQVFPDAVYLAAGFGKK